MVTTQSMPNPVQISFSKKLLAIERPDLIFATFADKRSLKGNSGKTLRMQRYDKIAKSLVPLGSSGVTPPESSLSTVYIDSKISFYGQWVNINEQVPLTNESPVLNQATMLLGEAMKETEDALIRNMLATTATAIDAIGGINGDTVTEIALTDIQDAVMILMKSNAKKLSTVIGGANKYGTAPVRSSYFGLSDVNLSSSLSNIAGFTHTSQYPSQSNISPAEYGAVGGVRFLLSSEGSVEKNASGLGKDVYNTFIVGMESYASIKLDNYSSKFVHRNAMYSGPLALNQSVGYKMASAQTILNDNWILNLKSTQA